MYLPKLSNYKSAAGALALAAVLPLALTGCQDEEFGYSKEEIRAAAYDRNFVAKYGEVDPEQSWDLSKYASASRSLTRASVSDDGIITCDFNNDDTNWFAQHVTRQSEWYYVDPALVNTFTNQLKEGDNNSDKGGPFTLTSNGTFYIIPMFQGASGIESDLHMVVTTDEGTYDRCIWDKSSFLQKQIKGSFDWNGLTQKMDFWADYGNKEEDGVYKGSTLYAKDVRSNPIKCEVPVGASVKFYLHITRGHMNYSSQSGNEWNRWTSNKKEEGSNWGYDEPNLALTGIEQWSDKGKMIALKSEIFQIDEETKKKYGNNVMLIGCEDAMYGKEDAIVHSGAKGATTTTYKYTDSYTGKDGNPQPIKKINNAGKDNEETVYWEGDNDMNDIIFMVVSNALPDVVRIDEVKKRYIVEDLGSIVDWDFNDIVVDMIQTTNYTTGVVTQKAILKHLCGTTPFELFVGEAGNESASTKLNFTGTNIEYVDYLGVSQSFSISNGIIPGRQMAQKEELNIEYNLPNTAWDPDNNNIWIKVYNENGKYTNRLDPNGGVNFGGEVDSDHNGNYTYNDNNTVSGPGSGNGVVQGEINDDFNLEHFSVVAFPRKGKVPRIIAVDTDYEWTAEDIDIKPEMWSFVHINATSSDTSKGAVSGAGSYRVGKTVILTAIAKDKDYEFKGWSDGNKEITRSFTATEDINDLVATFGMISIEDANGNIYDKEGNGGATQYAGYIVNNADVIRQRMDAGFNTITIITQNATDASEFAILKPDWSRLVASDALTYNMMYKYTTVDGKTYSSFVLSEDQMNAMKESGGFIIQKFSNDPDSKVVDVMWEKTLDYYTINLAAEIEDVNNHLQSGDHDYDIAKVVTGDRKTWNRVVAFGSACYPATDKVTLTAQIGREYRDEYYFSHWTDTKGNLVKENPITLEARENLTAYFKLSPTLKLSCDEENVKLYVGNEEITSAGKKVAPGTEVSIKASYTDGPKNGQGEPVYRFMWSGVDDIADSEENAATTFIMPEGDVEITAQVLFKTTPQIYLDGATQPNYQNAYGTVTLEWNGRKSENTSPLYVPAEAQVKATAIAKPGYRFKAWKYSNNTTTATWTFTRSSDKKEAWQPQAEFYENSHEDVRTIWSGSTSATNWNNQGAKPIDDMISLDDTYENTLMRVYVTKTDNSSNAFALQVKTGGILPPEADANGNFGAPSGDYVDIMMNEAFFNALKNNKSLVITGNNSTVTEVQLVPYQNLTNPDWMWNSEGSDPVHIKGEGGCGWDNMDTDLTGSYTTFTVNAKAYSNAECTAGTDAKIRVTVHNKTANTYNGNSTLSYNYDGAKPIAHMYAQSDKECYVKISHAYLTK